MPNRIIKESICTSSDIDKLTAKEEVFFYRLIVNCDDYGRLDARLSVLKSKLYPLREQMKSNEIKCYLEKLHSLGMIILYQNSEKVLVQLTSWQNHQQIRNKRSKYPAPADENSEILQIAINCNQLQSNVTVIQSNPIQSNTESESESEYMHGAANAPSVPTIALIILNDKSVYQITQEQVQHWGELYPSVDIVQEVKKMQGWSEANPTKRKTQKGINKFITNWLSREQDKGGTSSGNYSGNSKPKKVEQGKYGVQL